MGYLVDFRLNNTYAWWLGQRIRITFISHRVFKLRITFSRIY
jgi:hypothetical protein